MHAVYAGMHKSHSTACHTHAGVDMKAIAFGGMCLCISGHAYTVGYSY